MSEVKQCEYASREMNQRGHVEDSQSLKTRGLQHGVVLQYVGMVHLGKTMLKWDDGPGKGPASNTLLSF